MRELHVVFRLEERLPLECDWHACDMARYRI